MTLQEMVTEWLRQYDNHERDWAEWSAKTGAVSDYERHSEYDRLIALYKRPMEELSSSILEVIKDAAYIVDGNRVVYYHLDDGAINGWLVAKDVYKPG